MSPPKQPPPPGQDRALAGFVTIRALAIAARLITDTGGSRSIGAVCLLGQGMAGYRRVVQPAALIMPWVAGWPG